MRDGAVPGRGRAPRDIWAGLVFVGIGLVALVQVRRYPIGSLTAMGPGYFPLILSVLLILLGLGSVAKGMLRAGPALDRRWPLLPLAVLVGGIALFGVLVEASGLLPAVFVLAVTIGYGDLRRHPLQVILSALVLSVGATLIFVRFLGMPIQSY